MANRCTTDAWGTPQGATFPVYITFDFGDQNLVAEQINIITHYGHGQGVTDLDIEIEKDQVWVPVASHIHLTWNLNTDDEETREIKWAPTTTSKVRLKIDRSNQQWGTMAINEIQLLGVPATTAQPSPKASSTH